MSAQPPSRTTLQSLARRILADGLTRFIADRGLADEGLRVEMRAERLTVEGAPAAGAQRERLIEALQELNDLLCLTRDMELDGAHHNASLPQGVPPRRFEPRSADLRPAS